MGERIQKTSRNCFWMTPCLNVVKSSCFLQNLAIFWMILFIDQPWRLLFNLNRHFFHVCIYLVIVITFYLPIVVGSLISLAILRSKTRQTFLTGFWFVERRRITKTENIEENPQTLSCSCLLQGWQAKNEKKSQWSWKASDEITNLGTVILYTC